MIICSLALFGLLVAPQLAEAPDAAIGEPKRERGTLLAESVDTKRLARWHDLVASEPHAAGSEGDAKLIKTLSKTLEGMGLEVQVHPFTAYLSAPKSASLALVSPLEIELPVAEPPLPGAPASEVATIDQRLGWNAYSGSGDVTAGVVYANYGRLEDFEELKAKGIDCSGKIVITRYGGNFRGYKAKYAEAAGAAGLLIYTDPRDSGFGRGMMSPDGGWATCDQIQRGSLKTLPWAGDPLTPGVEATESATRLDPKDVALPTIPVQPCGWVAATQIMSQMKGTEVPKEWQGGMPFRYRLTGGDDLVVRLSVQQERSLVRTANVIARLPAADETNKSFGTIIGCHHDAWVYGASDPTSGLIALLEAAQVLADDARENGAPLRPITFAAWGAEEHGIIGSTEWVEGREDSLVLGADLYINLDAASGGMNMRIAASPSLTPALKQAARTVPLRGERKGSTAFDSWRGKSKEPSVGFLGGGSDHVGFLARTGVPSVSINASGAAGTAYHSLYDDLTWYRRVVGDDYAPAAMVTGLTLALSDAFARSRTLPLAMAETERSVHAALTKTLTGVELDEPSTLLKDKILAACAASATEDMSSRVRAGDIDIESDERAASIDALHRALDRTWLRPSGLPERPWYKNTYTAPDETSGYAPWPLPGIQKACHEDDSTLLLAELTHLMSVLEARHALRVRLAGLYLGRTDAPPSGD